LKKKNEILRKNGILRRNGIFRNKPRNFGKNGIWKRKYFLGKKWNSECGLKRILEFLKILTNIPDTGKTVVYRERRKEGEALVFFLCKLSFY